MAGAGYKLFNTGDVLTAAQVNTYLMEQTVMVFADAAARTTALSGVVSEGMISYLKDTNAVEVYNGSAWVASDDPNAIQNTIVDAKGDLISASAADTPARLAVGNNGDTLVADSSATTGLRWQGNYAAGKNKIINGDFSIWQRGTTFTNLATNTYTADRWYASSSDSTIDFARSTFTPGAAPVAGYESEYFMNIAIAATDSDPRISQRIEDVRTLAGQTVTVSFWAKSTVTTDALRWVRLQQFMGSGGSATINTDSAAISLSATWTRYSVTLTLPSLSGATIGANNWLGLFFGFKASTAQTVDIWGVQLEAGNVATAFQTATGTLAGELALAQRYYQRFTGSTIGVGFANSTTVAQFVLSHKVPLRNGTITLGQNTMGVWDTVNFYNTGTWGIAANTSDSAGISYSRIAYTHGTAVLTQYRPYLLQNNDGNSWMEVSAEL